MKQNRIFKLKMMLRKQEETKEKRKYPNKVLRINVSRTVRKN